MAGEAQVRYNYLRVRFAIFQFDNESSQAAAAFIPLFVKTSFALPGSLLNLKLKLMRGILYIIAVILVIGWAIGLFFHALGGLIHILLVIAVIAFLLGIIRRA